MANRLQYEDSPYLQQHKNNPVDWWPWCDEAFEIAVKENKAIFISIGYSSCHWCHVMEREVFENDACATILNEHFISIKVDREERPDVDKYYQEVYQLLNNRAGGWPTSIFCTPQNKPFYAGTYIPPESQEGSIEGMGFKAITHLIAKKVQENDPKLFENAEEVVTFLSKENRPKEATVLKEEFYKTFLNQARNNYDTRNGGFSQKPKFPHVSTLFALLHIDKLYKEKSVAPMVRTTLDNMQKGGMYDLVDGGFCRYSVDEKWLVPHFEKMLYDNALLSGIYLQAYLTYDEPRYLQTAKECVDFWFEFMSEENLFFSASDADTDGEEGIYYTYSYQEVFNLLEENGYEDIKTMCTTMDVTCNGNFEGRNIIRFEDGNIPEWFDKVRPLLSELRKQRTPPFIDKKVQTSWSAMMINTLFHLGSIDNTYKTKAINTLDALLHTMFQDDTLYHTTLIHKQPKVEAFLEDYAFLAQALLSGYNYTQNELYLINAQRLINKALEEFYNNGKWNFSHNELVVEAEVSDSTYTSSISIMVENLLTLSTLLADEKYRFFAFKTLEYNSYELGRKPIYYPYILVQNIRYLKGDRIIKTSETNLHNHSKELAKLHYPFTYMQVIQENHYMVCGTSSCFATTTTINELNTLVNQSL